MNAIEITDLDKSFKSFPKSFKVLEKINLHVKQGDIFGFIGPNGAGKTTLIKIIMGMLLPDQGAVQVMGFSPMQRDAKRYLGYLPERPYYHDFLTGAEFLQFHGQLFNMTPAEIKKRTNIVLEQVDLLKGRHLELRKYSKGMLQRIGLAQALLHNPDVLILDEPMSGLDPVGRREVRDLILHIASSGKTIFFSTHIVHDVEVICSNVGFINHGRLKAIDDVHAALNKTIHSVEIRFNMTQNIKGIKWLSHAKQAADSMVLEVKLGHDLDTILKTILEHQGHILSVTPRKNGLEELFFEQSKNS